jgi:2-polyprenyl-3-methyl-5-hydroxy-6-metoxy-1,4-benzoquinol methylase
MEPAGDLTTAESWDELWKKSGGTFSPVSSARKRLRRTRDWYALLAQLLDSAGRGEGEVLELGCAPGAMLLTLHELRPGHRYSGIDFAPAGLEVARAQLAASGVEATLHSGDIRTAEIPAADLVMSFGLIEHFDSPVEVMADHRRFVKPGGMVAVTVPNYAHPRVVKLLRRFSPETLATHNLEIMSPAAMVAALTSAGFTEVEAGYAGGPSLPSSRVRRDFSGRMYGFGARVWNVCSGIFSEGRPWAAHVWATGRNPVEEPSS